MVNYRIYEEFEINKKTGESNITQLYKLVQNLTFIFGKCQLGIACYRKLSTLSTNRSRPTNRSSYCGHPMRLTNRYLHLNHFLVQAREACEYQTVYFAYGVC